MGRKERSLTGVAMTGVGYRLHGWRSEPRHIPPNAVAAAAFESLRHSGQGKASPVFPGCAGEAVQEARGRFKHAAKRAGLVDFKWHDLRHTFASWLVMAGVDLRTVVERMGHQTAQMTVRYAHLAPEHSASAVDRLLVLKPAQQN
jgi:integrase